MGSIYTFHFPDIGEGVVEGEVVKWLKQLGDTVKQDEPVLTVMTDKATVELPAPHPGILVKQFYKEGEIAVKDKPLYQLEIEADVPSKESHSPDKEKPIETKKTQPNKVVKQQAPSSGAVLALPKVRKLAEELGVNLSAIKGSGPEGRIILEDLKTATPKSETPLLKYEGDEEKALTGIKRLMAKKLANTRIPQFSYFEQVEVTRLIQLRESLKAKAKSLGLQLSYMPFFIKALSIITQKHPYLNSSMQPSNSSYIEHKQHNIGIAMASPQGLVVPVLKGVQEMGLEEVIRKYEELKSKTLAGKNSPEDMQGATITISNFGILGDGMWATPMISDPEVAILGLSKIRKAPVIKDEQLVIREVLMLSWSFDHRLIDGAMAAQISHDYCTLLRDPASLT